MSVHLQRDGVIATITIDAPPVNLYSRALHAAFDAALDEVEAELPRVLVIRAAGKLVSGGVDVSEFHAQKTKAETLVLYDRMMELPARIERLDVPVVFLAHGLTLTWALEIALACDLVFASEKARFGLVERVIGLTPTMGGTQRLAARAGVARAKQVVFTGDLFDAATFERWNIVNEVVSVEAFEERTSAVVEQLAVGPTQAFGAAKQILREFEAATVHHAVERTTRIAAGLFDTEDLQSGMTSFLKDGPGRATFHGR